MMIAIILFLNVYYLPGSVLSLMHMTTLCHTHCKHPNFISEGNEAWQCYMSRVM